MKKIAAAARAKLSSAVTKVRETARSVIARLSKNRVTAPVIKAARVVTNIVVAVLSTIGLVVVMALTIVVLLVVALLSAIVTVVHKVYTLAYVLPSALMSAILGRGTARYELHCGWIVLTRWSCASFVEANNYLFPPESLRELEAKMQAALEVRNAQDITVVVERTSPPVVSVHSIPRPTPKKRTNRSRSKAPHNPKIVFGEAG